MKTQIVVIGGGPAGITAAIQLKRYGYRPVLIEKRKIGGLLRNAGKVENYMGFMDGPTGEHLSEIFERQLRSHDIPTLFETVEQLDYDAGKFSIKTDKSSLTASIVVVASGTYAKIHKECKVLEDGLYTEVSQMRHLEGKSVLIIGAGDAAFDYALTLSVNNSVTIVNRGVTIKALDLLKHQVFNTRNIKYLDSTSVSKISKNSHNKKEVVLISGENQAIAHYDCILNAIGREPLKDFYSSSVQVSEEKLIDSGQLFLIGDVKNKLFRQVAISSGDGLKAAMKINNILQKEQAL